MFSCEVILIMRGYTCVYCMLTIYLQIINNKCRSTGWAQGSEAAVRLVVR
jgi:hypothetical protein